MTKDNAIKLWISRINKSLISGFICRVVSLCKLLCLWLVGQLKVCEYTRIAGSSMMHVIWCPRRNKAIKLKERRALIISNKSNEQDGPAHTCWVLIRTVRKGDRGSKKKRFSSRISKLELPSRTGVGNDDVI